MGKPSKGSGTMTKADEKFEKKLRFYAKVRDTVASLSAKKEIGKDKKHRKNRLKAYDLSALSEFLPELNASRDSTAIRGYTKLNCKNRQKLIMEEGKNLSNVLSHPAFKADPLGSIHQHLQSTQPAVEDKPKKKMNKNGSKKKNRKKGKALSQPQSMDM